MLELRYLPLLLVHTQQSFFIIGPSSEEMCHRLHARTVSEEKPGKDGLEDMEGSMSCRGCFACRYERRV